MTAAIGTGVIGGPAAYSDAAAVDAMTAWREAQPPVIVMAPVPITLATFVPVVTMTTTALAGGVYSFALNMLTSGTNAGSLIEVRVFIDGIDVFGIGPRYNFGDTSAKIPFAGTLPLALGPGSRLIEMRAAHPPSPGVAAVDYSTLMLERYL